MKSSTVFGVTSLFLILISIILSFVPFEVKVSPNFYLALSFFVLGILFNNKATDLHMIEKENEKKIESMKKDISEVK